MHIEIIHSQGSGVMNEDHYLIRDMRFGVFDGMTSLQKYVSPAGKTGGYLASRNTRDVFAREGDLDSLAMTANYEIGQMMGLAEIDRSDPCNLWGTSAAVVDIDQEANELRWLKIYDSKILLVYEAHHTFLGRTHDHDVPSLQLLKMLSTEDSPMENPGMIAEIERVRRLMNQDYGCINGSSNVGNYIDSDSLPLGGLQSVILFTDGLEYPKEDPLAENDWNRFVKGYREFGLRGLANGVRMMESLDPNCKKYPRFKQHDDIAAIAVTL